MAAEAQWKGPFQLRDWLENCLEQIHPDWWNGEFKRGVYLLSARPWIGVPTSEASVLYVGGNAGPRNKSKKPKRGFRFKARIGECVSGILGFRGRHSIQKYVYNYCHKNGVTPLDLYFGWVEGVPCSRCAEMEVYRTLSPAWNRKLPDKCLAHLDAVKVCFPGALMSSNTDFR